MNVTFETLPAAVGELHDKLDRIDRLLSEADKSEQDYLLTIEQLMDYLPERPARQTIYGKVNDRLIPFEKHGKRLYFRKSTIDTWLSNGRQMNAIIKPLR